MNPVAKVKSGSSSIVSFVKSHPFAALVFGVLFGAFVFPFVATQLGKLRARGGLFAKIPDSFVR